MSNFENIDLDLFKKYKRIGIAFSGGVDSHALLYFLSKHLDNTKVFALHINHGLSPKSDNWKDHCAAVAEELGISFQSWNLNIDKSNSFNEEFLRNARYSFLSRWADKEDLICTAHHSNDQLETLLFRLIRGTGVNGMRGIKKRSTINGVNIYRPFLELTKNEIIEFAQVKGLDWVEDESNQANNFDRNFIRNILIPKISSRWPFFINSVISFSNKASMMQDLLDQISEEDIKNSTSQKMTQLSIKYIKSLSVERVINLLHRWISLLSNKQVDSVIIHEIYNNLINARIDSSPRIVIGKIDQEGSIEIRRYEDSLYAYPYTKELILNKDTLCIWDTFKPLTLLTGKLSAEKVLGKGLKHDKKKQLEVRGRTGGEIIRLPGRNCSKSLKTLFQENSILPWLRNRLPLIYINNELAAVANLWLDERFAALENEEGIELDWVDDRFS